MARPGGNRKQSSRILSVEGVGQRCRLCTSTAKAYAMGLAGIAVVMSVWLYASTTTRIKSAPADSWTQESDDGTQTLDLRSRSINNLELGQQQHGEGDDAGLVLIKSFKTGSTTLATYIAQIGHQREAYFLHPMATGWFARGELESRRDQGQTFDISLRHITPFTPYSLLKDLVPGAVFVTIMRDPLERFLSLFNFRGELKRRFRTPEALITAIRAGHLPLSDARPFCNQLAWLMSGEDVDYTRVDGEDQARRVSKAVIDEAAKRNVTVLLTERMSESISVLADRMGWRMGDDDGLQLRVSSQRVQKREKSGRESSFFSCGDDHMCVSAIRSCNMVDVFLYEHYEAVFDAIVQRLPSPERARSLLDEMPPAKSSMSRLELGTFPVNCIESRMGTSRGDMYSRLHACDGRPR